MSSGEALHLHNFEMSIGTAADQTLEVSEEFRRLRVFTFVTFLIACFICLTKGCRVVTKEKAPRLTSGNRPPPKKWWVLVTMIAYMLRGVVGLANPYSPLGCALVWLVWTGGPWVACVESVVSSVTHGLPLLGSGGGGITPGPSGSRLEGRLDPGDLSPEASGWATPSVAARHRAPGTTWVFDVEQGIWIKGAQLKTDSLQETHGSGEDVEDRGQDRQERHQDNDDNDDHNDEEVTREGGNERDWWTPNGGGVGDEDGEDEEGEDDGNKRKKRKRKKRNRRARKKASEESKKERRMRAIKEVRDKITEGVSRCQIREELRREARQRKKNVVRRRCVGRSMARLTLLRTVTQEKPKKDKKRMIKGGHGMSGD